MYRFTHLMAGVGAALIACTPASAQATHDEFSLLGTLTSTVRPRIEARTPREPAKRPITGQNEKYVTALAQFVAAELGADSEAPLETRTAVAAAAIRASEWAGGATPRTFDAARVTFLRETHRRLLTQGYDGQQGLVSRSLAWMSKNGYALSVEAARAALLDEADPSLGAQWWSDMFGADELERVARQHRLTVSLPTSRGPIIFFAPAHGTGGPHVSVR